MMPPCSRPSSTLRAAYGGALRACLTAAVRDELGERRSGRRDGRLDRTTGLLLGIRVSRSGPGRPEADGQRMVLTSAGQCVVAVVEAGRLLLLSEQILQLAAIAVPDFSRRSSSISQHGERLLGVQVTGISTVIGRRWAAVARACS